MALETVIRPIVPTSKHPSALNCERISARFRPLDIVVFLLAFCLLMVGCVGDGEETVTIDGETFTMELALDDEARSTGMSYRDSFPEGGGMLFVFPEPQVLSFWMYECLMDIDVIFLDRYGVVVATHQMKQEPPRGENETDAQYKARLRSYSSYYPAQFAIELPGGTLDRLNVRVDDRIDLDLDRLKGMAEWSDDT